MLRRKSHSCNPLLLATSLLFGVLALSIDLSAVLQASPPLTSGAAGTDTINDRTPNAVNQHSAVLPVPDNSATATSAPHDIDPTSDLQILHLIVGQSTFVNSKERLRRIYVSNPSVLESVTATPNQLVITAKATGTSSLVVWKEGGRSTVYTVWADIDSSELQQSLTDAFPGDQILVRTSEGKVYLSGVVGSTESADQAGKLALSYSKDVINGLLVAQRHRPQVRLEVRFAEVDRSKLDSFGINLIGLGSQSMGLGSTQQFGPPAIQNNNGQQNINISDFLNLFYFNITHGFGISIKDLQTKEVLEILAEPTLMTISGQPARFLAGGEFPFPMIQPGSGNGATTVTIQFRPYGVKLEFTPYVNPDGTIRMKIAPEVSALDYTNVVVISGYTIPSISTRHVETEVELKNGQTFGISGILDRRTTDTFSKMPGIADIPILGQLFRSKGQNHSVMELIVVVTPTIVDPLTEPETPPISVPKPPIPFMENNKFDQGLPKGGQAPPAPPSGGDK